MNKLTIIGNLTKDPEMRTTTTGRNVCSFTVAVNRRKKNEGQPDADFFKVSAWDQNGENCQKYLRKGRKVCVIGPVSVRAFTTQSGEAAASMEVMAQEVEFLSSKHDDDQAPAQEPEKKEERGGFIQVETDELPF